ncbi:hypothetical protein O4J56_06790 [Nocardiopsis sp. RSe5-2]|uniref:Uncharacterized protein n=1 Tax=Nocardiopsis endophytica TaxID=3018445 RepID=A0ABT4U070_9ACTN|nr:hypothetical protein [Nocardiopsis endophytica]MDA2810341.1 hypothetical protein [Nocardiopsis endophytica]
MDTTTCDDNLRDAKDARDQELLNQLNAAYHGRWRIWRSVGEDGAPAAWVATNIGVTDAAPTLHATTPERLQAELESPPARCARRFSGLGGVHE